ncbi:MAG: LAGLIDADG family homing endonuclease [Candidatus Pacebacteria bacterium]|nr:LAGLIDADG family homing endonuclease [Candidatus Paceibacterota bacterium]
MAMHRAVNKDFFKKWSPEMAYVLGFFAADGYMTLNSSGARYWNIQITDRIILERIKKAIQSDHKISVRIRRGNEKIIYRLQIGNKVMCADLQALGFSPNKTKSLAIPHVPKKYLSHFVRGYFDGDGNVWTGYIHKERKSKLFAIQTVFTSCSHEFLLALREQLEAFGIGKGVLSKGMGNYYRLTYSINNSLKLSDFMYNQVTPTKGYIYLERKRRKFQEFIKMRKGDLTNIAAVAQR